MLKYWLDNYKGNRFTAQGNIAAFRMEDGPIRYRVPAGDGAGAGSGGDGDDAGDEGGDGDDAGDDEGPKKLSFTQAEFDEHINKRVGRVVAQKEKAWFKALPEPVRELLDKSKDEPELLERLPDFLSTKGEGDKTKVNQSDVEKLLNEREKRVRAAYTPLETERDGLKTENQSLKAKIRRGELQVAAGVAGALPEAVKQVVVLVESFFNEDEDTGELYVQDYAGNIQIDPDTSKPFTPEGFIKTWLNDNPHFLPANMRPGGSSRNGANGKGRDGASIDDLKELYDKLMSSGKLTEALEVEAKMAPMRAARYAGTRK
jgi:hypothetical protein